MIDLSSVSVKEHLTDCNVVVIQVFGEPLLGDGLLIELDVSLCEEVVVGLITCEGEVIVTRPHLRGETAQGILLNLKEDEGQEEVLGKKMKKRSNVNYEDCNTTRRSDALL